MLGPAAGDQLGSRILLWVVDTQARREIVNRKVSNNNKILPWACGIKDIVKYKDNSRGGWGILCTRN